MFSAIFAFWLTNETTTNAPEICFQLDGWESGGEGPDSGRCDNWWVAEKRKRVAKDVTGGTLLFEMVEMIKP